MFNLRVIIAFILGSTFGAVGLVAYALWDDKKITERKARAHEEAMSRLDKAANGK